MYLSLHVQVLTQSPFCLALAWIYGSLASVACSVTKTILTSLVMVCYMQFVPQGFSSPSLRSKCSRMCLTKSGCANKFLAFGSFSHSCLTLCVACIALAHFLRGPNAKNSFALPDFVCLVQECLLRRLGLEKPCGTNCYSSPSHLIIKFS